MRAQESYDKAVVFLIIFDGNMKKPAKTKRWSLYSWPGTWKFAKRRAYLENTIFYIPCVLDFSLQPKIMFSHKFCWCCWYFTSDTTVFTTNLSFSPPKREQEKLELGTYNMVMSKSSNTWSSIFRFWVRWELVGRGHGFESNK